MRGGSQEDQIAPFPILTGGLDTRLPPNRISPSRSPDLLNVEFSEGQVRKRGGFKPHLPTHLPASAIHNTGFRGKVDLSGTETDTLIVPGALYGGHRDVWEDVDRWTIDFFFRPQGLAETTHAGNGQAAGANNPFSAAPFDLLVRPILSKGPQKKSMTTSWDLPPVQPSEHFGAPAHNPGAMLWNRSAPYGQGGEIINPVSQSLTGGGTTVDFTLGQPTSLTGTFSGRVINLTSDLGDESGVYTVTVVSPTLLRISLSPTASSLVTTNGVATIVAEPDIKSAGMPFCFWLGRDTTGDPWGLRLSVHSHEPTLNELWLTTVEAPVPIEEGRLYHVIGTCNYDDAGTGQAALLIGTWFDEADDGAGGFVYDVIQTSQEVAGALGYSPTPIQAFDCPQAFVEAPGGISAGIYTVADWNGTTFESLPPGLGLDPASSGGYFFAAKRGEGYLEDVACWSVSGLRVGDRGLATFERNRKIDLEVNSDELIQYWSFDRPGEGYVQEVTGRGNHLYRSPRPPIFDKHSGGKKKGSYWFNGISSYFNAAGLVENPNWRYMRDDAGGLWTSGCWQNLVRRQEPHGLQVEFWIDDAAPLFEAVIVEVHSVMRIALRPDGRIAVYVRDDTQQAGSGPIFARTPNYYTPHVSSFRVEAGQRYSISAVNFGTTLRVYVEGLRVDSALTVPGIEIKSWPLGGLSIGAGCKSFTNYSNDPDGQQDDDTRSERELNTDSRTHFMGRIESVAVLCGATGNDERDEHDSYKVYDPPHIEGRQTGRQLHTAPDDPSTTGRRTISASDPNDVLPIRSEGHAIAVGGHQQGGVRVRYPAKSGSTGNVQDLHSKLLKAAFGGAEQTEGTWAGYFYELGRWELSEEFAWDEGTIGSHSTYLEYREGPVPDITAGLEWQNGGPVDIYGCLGGLVRCSKEPDLISEIDETTTGFPLDGRRRPYMQHRYRPYDATSSLTLCPQWASGMVLGLTGTTPVGMIADWQEQSANEQLVIAAASRSLYWLRPKWRKDSPFAVRDDYSLWLGGNDGEHVEFPPAMPLVQFGPQGLQDGNKLAVEFWIKPHRLDKRRLVMSQGNWPVDGTFSTSPQYNYAIYLFSGRLVVSGQMSGSTYWRYREQGPFALGTQGIRSELRANEWNHVYVLMGATTAGDGVFAWVNGTRVDMVEDPAGSVVGSNPTLAQKESLYVGALPRPFAELDTATGVEHVDPFVGLITEIRVDNVESSRFPADASSPGLVPKLRYAPSGALRLLHLNDPNGPMEDSESTLTGIDTGSTDHGIDRLRRAVWIGSMDDDTSASPFSPASFRDRLYISNGTVRPMELLFSGYEFAEPIRAQTMGMMTPGAYPRDQDRVEKVFSPSRADLEGSVLAQGNYIGYVAFYDSDFRESEPAFLFEKTLGPEQREAASATGITATEIQVTFNNELDQTPLDSTEVTVELSGFSLSSGTGPDINGFHTATWGTATSSPWSFIIQESNSSASYTTGTITVHFEGIRADRIVPVSPDPQVVGRRFFMSASGGGAPIQHPTRLEDNFSKSVELWGGGTGVGFIAGRRLTPPRVRSFAVAQGVIAGGNAQFDIGLTAGGSLVAWSDGEDPIYWPSYSRLIVDSENGRPIVSVQSHLSRFYVMKRDSVWVLSLQGVSRPNDPGAVLAPVNQSIGPGGGATLYNNAIFGASEDGVYLFDGSAVQYLSADLEGLWPSFPRDDEDLLRMFGVFRSERQQYWLSLREEDTSDRVALLPTVEQNPSNEEPPGGPELSPVDLQESVQGNRLVFVLHTSFGDEGSLGAWSMFRVPEHSYMTRVRRADRSIIMIGSTSGAVYEYDEDSYIDAAEDSEKTQTESHVLDNPGYVRWNETPVGIELPDPLVSAVDSNSLTIASGSFPTIGEGLRGAYIVFLYTNTDGNQSGAYRRIESNDATTIVWRDALVDDPDPLLVAAIQLTIGGYDGYWSSGWLAPQSGGVASGAGGYLRAREIGLEFETQEDIVFRDGTSHPNELFVTNKTVIDQPDRNKRTVPLRQWVTSDEAELNRVDQSLGWLECPLAVSQRNRGRYFRMLLFTGGIRTPFAVDSWHLVWAPESGPRGGGPQGHSKPRR